MTDLPKKNKFLVKTILSLFGIGIIPFSPGTFASAATAIGWYYLLPSFSKYPLLPIFLALILIPTYFISVKLISLYLKPPIDKSWIVIDELFGMIISLLPTIFLHSPVFILIAFICFRFFDIVKPSYIKKIDALHTPGSVVLDDVVAGVYSATSVILISLFYL
ncbi:MAG: phosphatidylglycerophosphatase A [uncultured bacterium]|uniref:Phosphatidylglycerophosphatase A n=6 Tax=Candidatus Collieribacteriota TaxID=1752725 RepID=A0A0G1HIK0_9BACT|nr:MAG: phosphatidylglycerophosphatase A [uncultured bacterium]KKT35770.1 MAG: Phosphatidylglycerophosphatase A [Candidatus Collierbacteria bacterium GW2011_GWA1_44_12]KKT39550.1 MAG: Phosphatidylglycerophosphatase A [Candidatus Collierbacteria bacterium GW2011_GWF1_44_12]KKT47071.1 MAG: Phosphatidylglycerophosphatase A [Candidatus Collierbacteria bacterium GW2011_GWF2_44_15]KKT68045.1 MAG: Phosphatidylglycerophosphatase A [Candidatus Collierbacteria bacterium GW2011_GWB1_44_35]KKT99114.1 MAG: